MEGYLEVYVLRVSKQERNGDVLGTDASYDDSW